MDDDTTHVTFHRQREKEAEIAGDYRFKARLQKDRVLDAIAANAVGGETDSFDVAKHTFRDVDRRRWRGRHFVACSTPRRNIEPLAGQEAFDRMHPLLSCYPCDYQTYFLNRNWTFVSNVYLCS